MKFIASISVLFFGCATEVTPTVDNDSNEISIVETSSTLTIQNGPVRVRVDVGPMDITNEANLRQAVDFGRTVHVEGLTHAATAEAESSKNSKLRLIVPFEYQPFLTEPQIADALSRWGVTFDWVLEAAARRVAEGVDGAHKAGFDQNLGHVAYTPFFGSDFCTWMALPSGAGIGFWPGGSYGPETACRDWNYGNGDGFRQTCNQANGTNVMQKCNIECTQFVWDGPAKSCSSDADCPWGCGQNGIEGRCSSQGFCQSETDYGWTGPLGCAAQMYQTGISYCSCDNGWCHAD